MALVVKDRVQETTTTTGTGTVTLAGAVSGFQSFSVIGDGNTTYYSITGGAEWEIGIGTYTASGTTLSRDTVLESSNSGSLVNFSAGSKTVFCTYPAERSMYVDGTTITPATTATLPVVSGGTGANTLTSNSVILGNGTSAVQFVAPGTSGNVLTSDGTTWLSQVGGGGTQDYDLVLTSSVSPGSTEFNVTGIPTTGGGNYVITVACNVSATGGTQPSLAMRFSIDNGSSYYSTVGDYIVASAQQNMINLGNTPSTSTTCTYYCVITLWNSTGNNDYTSMHALVRSMNFSSACGGTVGALSQTVYATFKASYSPINAIKFLRNTGTRTYDWGLVKVYRTANS